MKSWPHNAMRYSSIFILLPPLLYIWLSAFYQSGFLASASSCMLLFVISSAVYCSRSQIAKVSFSGLDFLIIIFLLFVSGNGLIHRVKPLSDDDLIMWISYVPFYVCAKLFHANGNEKKYNAFSKSAAICVILQCAIALLQQAHILQQKSGLFPMTGTFLNPAILCSYVVVLLPFITYHTTSVSNSMITFVYILATLCAISLMVILESRGPLIAALATVYVSWMGIRPSKKLKVNPLGFLALLVGLAISLVFIKKESTSGRLLIWEISSRFVSEHPITGIGLGNFQRSYNIYQAEYFEKQRIKTYRTPATENYFAYNDFYTILIENGIIGLLLFIAITALAFTRARNIYSTNLENKSLAATITSILCVLFLGLTSFPLEEPSILLIFSYLLASLPQSTRKYTLEICLTNRAMVKRVVTTAMTVSLCLIVPRLYYFGRWFSLVNEPWSSPGLMERYRDIYPVQSNNGLFLTNFANNLIRDDDMPEAKLVLEKAVSVTPSIYNMLLLGQLQLESDSVRVAERIFLTASYMVPSLFRPKEKLLHLYAETAQWEAMRQIATIIYNMPVKIPSPEVTSIRKDAMDLLKSHPP